MRLPDLRVQPQVNGTPQYSAPRVVPQQDASGEQIANLGQGLAVGGYAMSRAADFLQDEVDAAKSQTEFNLFAEETRKIERAYEAQEGEAAVNGLEPTMKALEENRKRFEARLDNEEQHKRFASRADVHEFHVRDRVERHNTAQTRNYNIGAQSAGAKDSNTEYLDLWRRGMPQDPQGQANWINATKLARETGLRQINKVSDLHGDSPEVRKQAVLAHTTDMHSNVVDLLMTDRPEQAAAYLQRYASEIDPRGFAAMERRVQGTLERKTISDQSLKLFHDILKADESQTLGRATAIIDETFKGKRISADLRDATVARFEHYFRGQAQAQAAATNSVRAQAENWLIANKLSSVEEMPAELYAEAKSRGLLGDLNTFSDSGGRYPTNPQAFLRAMSLPDAQLARLTDAEVEAFRVVLNDKDLATVKAKVAKAQGKATPDQESLLTKSEMLRDFAAKAVSVPRDKSLSELSNAELGRYYAAINELDERVQAFTRESLGNKRGASQKEVQEIADRMVLDDAELAGASFTIAGQEAVIAAPTRKPVFAMTPEEQERAFVTIPSKVRVEPERVLIRSVPPPVRAEIQRRLQARGLSATTRDVVTRWVQLDKPQTLEALK